MRERGFVARTVGIKIRFADFTTVTRVRTLAGWTDATATIYDTAAQLYDALKLDRPRIRLVGVKCENLREAGEVAEQLSFDDLLRHRRAASGRRRPRRGARSDSAPCGDRLRHAAAPAGRHRPNRYICPFRTMIADHR